MHCGGFLLRYPKTDVGQALQDKPYNSAPSQRTAIAPSVKAPMIIFVTELFPKVREFKVQL